VSEWFESYGFTEVFPELMIGAYPLDTGDVDELAASGVRRVLNLAQDAEYHEAQRTAVQTALARHEITEVRLSIVDFGQLPADRLDQAVGTVVGWMDDGVRSYVHCRAGWQRSAAVAAGAVAVFNDVDISTALDWIRAHRSTANPLSHQRADLLDWWSARGRQQAAAHSAGEARATAAATTTADPTETAAATTTADPTETADASPTAAATPAGPAPDALHTYVV
jgi:predicted protein tyrosine phosphatase